MNRRSERLEREYDAGLRIIGGRRDIVPGDLSVTEG